MFDFQEAIKPFRFLFTFHFDFFLKKLFHNHDKEAVIRKVAFNLESFGKRDR